MEGFPPLCLARSVYRAFKKPEHAMKIKPLWRRLPQNCLQGILYLIGAVRTYTALEN